VTEVPQFGLAFFHLANIHYAYRKTDIASPNALMRKTITSLNVRKMGVSIGLLNLQIHSAYL
jgi:hypothetical protein